MACLTWPGGADTPIVMQSRSFITGLAGTSLLPDERAFLRDSAPWGLILFARNVEAPDQVRALVQQARDALGWNAPVLIDQEGGRVQRLRPPHWPNYAPAEAFVRSMPVMRRRV